jgi:hypothetical protein
MIDADVGVMELSGKPGHAWGNMVIPTLGKTRFRMSGDMIQASSRLFFGLEKKQIHTRIQNVDSVELVQGRLWWLLWLGIPMLSLLIGIVPIIAFFAIKRRWLTIYSQNAVLTLFYESEDTERASQFSQMILDRARQLNKHSD